MTLRIWICKNCGEEFWYDDDSIERVQCKCLEWMILSVHKGNISEHKIS